MARREAWEESSPQQALAPRGLSDGQGKPDHTHCCPALGRAWLRP